MASSSSSSPELPLSRSTNNHDPHLSIDHKLHEVLEDLSSRFILNLPDGELGSLERVCFQVEQAHWYYEDFVREQDPSLPTMTLKRFSNSLFHVCPLLSHWGDEHEQTFQSFLAYKTRVPVCGAIMLNETWDKCLLVKGWKATSAWSFPKGKINQKEQRHACAVREVLEETGYDLTGQIDPANVVELSIRDQSLSLYIVPNVPEDFPFETRTRKEISKISWFKLADLPTWKKNKAVPGKFYLITPFIGPLRAFLRDNKPRDFRRAGVKHIHPDKEAHLSADEDGQMDCGAIAHESSSQSSMENSDPHTPSPLYSEAVINHSENGVNHTMQKTLNMDIVDPHFARLLSSLSLSAKKTDVAAPPVADAPAPEPMMFSTPLGPSQQTLSQPSPARSPSHSGTARPSRSRAPSVAPQATISTVNPIHRDSSRIEHSTPPRNPSLSSAQAVLVNSASNGVLASISPSPTARRTIAPVNISPYLARAATAAPPVSKQLKYLSMLESVAKESESRMTPRIERQMAMRDGPSLPTMLGLPPPMPPNGAQFGPPGEPSLIYSSRAGPQAGFQPQPHPSFTQLPSAPSDDPFIVRPRTSNAFHPIPYGSFPNRPNNHEEQMRLLLSTTTSNRAPPMPIGGPYPPPHGLVGPHINGGGLPPFSAQPPYSPTRAQAPPNLRVIPPQHLPPSQLAERPPMSAPAVSPTFNRLPRANPTNNAHLLSILNSPVIPRATPGGPHPLLSNITSSY